MKIEILKNLVGKPVLIVKNDGFTIKGVIYALIDDTVEFWTSTQVSYLDASDIKELKMRPRLSWEDSCGGCGSVWYRRTSYDNCPFCSNHKSGCKGCK